MDRELIEEKVQSIGRCLQRIEAWLPPSRQGLASDLDAQDIVSVNLTRAIQVCIDTAAQAAPRGSDPPQSMGDAFLVLARNGLLSEELARRLRAAVGFRNLAIHQYAEIDWGRVHDFCRNDIDDLRQFAKAALGWSSIP